MTSILVEYEAWNKEEKNSGGDRKPSLGGEAALSLDKKTGNRGGEGGIARGDTR